MWIILFTDSPSFHAGNGCTSGEGFVGPFGTEVSARLWLTKNMDEGGTARVVKMIDVAEATLAN